MWKISFFKKSYRLLINFVIVYRSNASILGQKKKNQRKKSNKKRAQERRCSESEASEAEDKKDEDKINATKQSVEGEKKNNVEDDFSTDVFELDI